MIINGLGLLDLVRTAPLRKKIRINDGDKAGIREDKLLDICQVKVFEKFWGVHSTRFWTEVIFGFIYLAISKTINTRRTRLYLNKAMGDCSTRGFGKEEYTLTRLLSLAIEQLSMAVDKELPSGNRTCVSDGPDRNILKC